MQPLGRGTPMQHRSGTAHAWDSPQLPRWQQQQQRPYSHAWIVAWKVACRAGAQSRGMGPRPKLLHAWAAEQQLQPRLHANVHAWTDAGAGARAPGAGATAGAGAWVWAGADAGVGMPGVRSLMTKKQRRWQTAALPRQHALPPTCEAVPHCWLEVTERGVSVGGRGGRGKVRGEGGRGKGGGGGGKDKEVAMLWTAMERVGWRFLSEG